MEQMRQLAARALRGVRGAATGLGVGGAVRTVIAAGLLAGALPQVMTAPSPAAAATTLGYGMNGGEGKLDMITGMGFGWVKILVAWKQYEPSRGAYSWTDLDGRISRIKAKNLNILIRIDEIPDWASSRPGVKNAPPVNDEIGRAHV